MRRSLARRWPLYAVAAMVALYLVYFGWLTVRTHDAFRSKAFDLGIYDQIIWNTLHGRPFRSTFEEPITNSLGDHFEPIIVPLALSYLIWPNPKMLLLIQAAALALGALPVFWLARDRLARPLRSGPPVGNDTPGRPAAEILACALAGIYLLYPLVHSANTYDFHPSTLALPLLLFAFYFLRMRRLLAYAICVVLAMSTKETMPLTTFALGAYALFAERQRLAGAATMIASAAWFGLSVFVVIPHFNPSGESMYFRDYYGWLGASRGEILTTLITRPGLALERLLRHDSLLYVEQLLRPLLYIPLLGAPVLLLAAPALLLNLLSDHPLQHEPMAFLQHGAAIAPFAVIAAIEGTVLLVGVLGPRLERIGPVARRGVPVRPLLGGAVVGLMLVASLLVTRQHGDLPFSRDFYLPRRDERASAAQAIVQQVPAQGVVSTSPLLGPHLSQRQTIYLYPSLHDADYVAMDVGYRDALFPARDRFDSIQAMVNSGQYGVVDGRHGYLLLGKGVPAKSPPDALYDFARAGQASPQVKMAVDFGSDVRLVGYDLVWEKSVLPLAHLVLYWEALGPGAADLRLFFVETDSGGELHPGTEMEFAETVWYPPSRWQPGEVIRAETRWWLAGVAEPFGVAVGAVEGPGFWEVEKRLPPVVRSAPWPLPLLHGDSLLWLVTLQGDGQFLAAEPPATGP